MTVLPYGPHQYKVVSEGNVYWVDLKAEGAACMCSCADHIWRDRECKHIVAARCAEAEKATLSPKNSASE